MKVRRWTLVKPVVVLVVLAFLCGCNDFEPQNITLRYLSGETYIEGQVRDFGRYFGLKKSLRRVGQWKWFRPEGSLESLSDYDDTGSLLRELLFSADGDTISKTVYTDDTTVLTIYRESGVVWTVAVTTFPSGEDGLTVEDCTELYETGETYLRWRAIGDEEIHQWVYARDGRTVFDGRTDLTAIKDVLKQQ